MMQDVIELVHVSGDQTKPVFLPHCTWDKFGDILANSGGRCVGLFDELVSFFATMNMYSSTKMQLSDTKEYQDFLQMYTGKTKTRETGIGYIICYLPAGRSVNCTYLPIFVQKYFFNFGTIVVFVYRTNSLM
jgi:hypothetical protein